jgi:hypothetical protein
VLNRKKGRTGENSERFVELDAPMPPRTRGARSNDDRRAQAASGNSAPQLVHADRRSIVRPGQRPGPHRLLTLIVRAFFSRSPLLLFVETPSR